jgi:hypothetical protein
MSLEIFINTANTHCSQRRQIYGYLRITLRIEKKSSTKVLHDIKSIQFRVWSIRVICQMDYKKAFRRVRFG